MNAAAANILNKANEIPFINGVVTSAEKFWENTQISLTNVQEQAETKLSKVAQKNLLALAKRADQLSDALVALSEKLEPSVSVPKASRKSAEIKPAPKAAKPAPKAAAKSSSRAKAKAAPVVEAKVEVETPEVVAE